METKIYEIYTSIGKQKLLLVKSNLTIDKVIKILNLLEIFVIEHDIADEDELDEDDINYTFIIH